MEMKTSTHIRVMSKDLPALKNIKDRLSAKWERKASYPDAIHFLIRVLEIHHPAEVLGPSHDDRNQEL